MSRRPVPSELVDADRALVDRRIFWDADVYELELERIFGRCWLFVAHESQVPEPGSYVAARMGEDEVLVVRQRDGSLRVLLNSCPHRGNRVCHAEVGTARGFVCNYHGWSFGLDGSLRGMHESEAYDAEPSFDASALGLTPIPRVATYKGLVFASMAPDAPSLPEYLGAFTWYLDVLLDNDPAGTEFLPGSICSVIPCNWKIAAENFAGDALHAGWTHDSGAAAMLGRSVPSLVGPESYQVNMNGHCWEFNLDGVGNAATLGDPRVVDHLRERQAKVAERLGALRARMVGSIASATVFPNLSFLPGQNTFRTWQPLGPHRTEVRTWVLVNRALSTELKDAYRKGVMTTFSPAGVFEMDDGENWEHATQGNKGWFTRRQPLHYALGLNSAVSHPELPGNVHRGQVNDANHRAFYRRWADIVGAERWAEVPVGQP